MSQSRTAGAQRDLDPWNGLFYTVADRLTPLFKGEGRGKVYARYAAGEAIIGCHPDSRADYATIGRILALSLTTITAAEHASNRDLPTADLVRVLGKVHALSQAADRAEQSMMTRRRQMQQDGMHRDALVPRPIDRPSPYAPLPADDPASGAAHETETAPDAQASSATARAAEAAQEAPAPEATQEETAATQPDHHEPVQPAAPVRLAAADVETNRQNPESTHPAALPSPRHDAGGRPPVKPTKSYGQPMTEPVPPALRAVFESIVGAPDGMAVVSSRVGSPAMPAACDAAFRPASAEPSFRRHLLGSGAIPATDRPGQTGRRG